MKSQPSCNSTTHTIHPAAIFLKEKSKNQKQWRAALRGSPSNSTHPAII
jgi:hypothetical protein